MSILFCLPCVDTRVSLQGMSLINPKTPGTAICKWCGNYFTLSPFGKPAEFCSAKCRTYFNRDKKRKQPELALAGKKGGRK